MHKRAADHVFVPPASRQIVAFELVIFGALGWWASIEVWRIWAVGSALIAVGSTVLVGQSLLSLRNLRRPILRVAPGEIEHISLTRWSARHIRSSDVVAIASSSRSKVVLKTVSGRERIRLGWLSRAQRAEARAAIERWVANSDRAGAEPTGPEGS
jgi:hypothetical protein